MKTLNYLLLGFITLTYFSCSNDPQGAVEEDGETEEVVPLGNISLNPLAGSPEYADAKLMMNAPEDGALVQGDEVSFNYIVENYELGTQTGDAEGNGLANSVKGQHIHLILNNGPYSAHYEGDFNKPLEAGNYVALSFLSRSYHESVKNPNSYVLKTFSLGESDAKSDFDPNKSHLFYSRPKGTYVDDDTKKILLDFFLINTTLSEDGNKIRATIAGQEFMITKWQPYVIEGLPGGTNHIKLELLDKDGNPVPGPYNSVERTIILEKETPYES